MNNKVLIKLSIPELDTSFDIFIPVNELIWKIKKLLTKAVSDLEGVTLNPKEEYILLNKTTNKIYNNNESKRNCICGFLLDLHFHLFAGWQTGIVRGSE